MPVPYLIIDAIELKMGLVARKPAFGVSDQVRHKPAKTVTQDGYALELLALETIEMTLTRRRKSKALNILHTVAQYHS